MQTIGKIELKQLKDGKKVNVHISSLEGFEMTIFDVKNNLTPDGDFDDGEIQITSISKAHPERKIMPGVPTGIMISNSKGNLHLHIYLDPGTTQKFFEYLYLIAYGTTSPPKATPKTTSKKGAKASSKAKSKTKASPKKKRARLEDLDTEVEEEDEEEADEEDEEAPPPKAAKAKTAKAKAKATSKAKAKAKKVAVDPSSKLVVYTDGSAAPTNPGPGGWAAVLYEVQGEEEVEVDTSTGSYPHCGNGKMEITAAIAGLELLPLGCEDAELFTDAKYAADTIGRGVLGVHPKTGRKTGKPSGWIQGWKDHGWVKSSGGAPENLPEIKKLYTVLDKHIKAGSCIVIKWVKAHNGTPGNERADQLANEARVKGLRNR